YILNKHKINISFDQVVSFSGGHSLGRPHVARAMFEGGYVKRIQDAFDRYLGENRVAFVPKYHLTPKDAVDLINLASGIPILAHPVFLYKRINIFDLINFGIRGLEVTHTQHSHNDERYFKKICNDYHLLKTGGSDFHGILNERMLIGGKKIPYDYVKDLKKENQAILNLQY
ncbi:phosphatase, partial [Candidatus Dependentiae bacterium]|nr:phosphatase [Candidatus Dependentiae bacterium]